jgi:putative transposase
LTTAFHGSCLSGVTHPNPFQTDLWQRRYWEHTIKTELDYSRHIDDIHANPLKHGYVTRVQDWPYSTFHQYVHDGILVAAWCGDVDYLPTVISD